MLTFISYSAFILFCRTFQQVLVKDSWRSRFGLIAFHMIEKLLRRYPGTPCVCTLNSTQIDHWKVIKRVGLLKLTDHNNVTHPEK
eukprot:1385433-Amorphochlora_amoeboformis.AAC.1